MTDKKKKPRIGSTQSQKFRIEPKKTVAKPKPIEKAKSVKERIIEEHIKGMESPLIAQLLSVSNTLVAKVLYLHKQSEAAIIRPLVKANEQANKLIQTISDTLQDKPAEPKAEVALSDWERKDHDKRLKEMGFTKAEEPILENHSPCMYDSGGKKTDMSDEELQAIDKRLAKASIEVDEERRKEEEQ